MGSLINAVSFTLLEQGYHIGLDWLGQFARVIIEGIGIIGLGIIVFTLVLKAITLPFDIYQRVKMRKQTLIMRDMKDDLEKLQKQYANDKNMYNQKMMELYKKNGYSMFGACLPMIISLVVLILAFQGFRAYSNYANLNLYMDMSQAYNEAVLENGVDGIDFWLQKDEEGRVLVESNGKVTLLWKEASEDGTMADRQLAIDWKAGALLNDLDALSLGSETLYTMTELSSADGTTISRYLTVTASDDTKYLFYRYSLETAEIDREYQIDTERLLADADAAKRVAELRAPEEEGGAEKTENEAIKAYVVEIGATAAAEWYRANDPGFLWVKNVWYPDVSYNHPIQDYASFTKQFGNTNVRFEDRSRRPLSSVLTEDNYNDLTSQLESEKGQANGYFILIILSIGFMVLSQFISMRSSKESNQYQSVDGSGARTQKIMLVMMPLIYAIFAFMYSAAFSIYMTMSSIISLLVTLLSNLIIGRIFRKKEEQELKQKYTRRLPWQTTAETKGKGGKRNK